MLALLLACTSDPGTPPGKTDTDTDTDVPTCAADRTLVATITGAPAEDEHGAVGIFDSATWRLGDATPLTTVLSRDGGTFTLCLTGDPTPVRFYELAFWGGWIDLDGDARLDAATEPLCDRHASGALAEELYFADGAWRTGLNGAIDTPNVSLALPEPLDGDRCAL